MSGEKIDDETRLLAAIAYGEASTVDDSDEMGGIAFAVANRCRAWGGKTVSQLKAADPNYAYAWNGRNERFNKLMRATDSAIRKDAGMLLALEWAALALSNKGRDPSNAALWWDGLDFKTQFHSRPKVKDGFKFGDPKHNIFDVREKKREVIVRWKIKNKRTGQVIDGAERGRYDAVWVSTAAHGGTIFWKHPPEYISATGGKEYK